MYGFVVRVSVEEKSDDEEFVHVGDAIEPTKGRGRDDILQSSSDNRVSQGSNGKRAPTCPFRT